MLHAVYPEDGSAIYVESIYRSPFAEFFQNSLVRVAVNYAFSFWISLQKRCKDTTILSNIQIFGALSSIFQCKSINLLLYKQLLASKIVK